MNTSFSHFRPKNNIPKFRRNSKSFLFISEMMLIMILLKSMKISSFTLRSINKMKRIMSQVIDKIPNHKAKPKTKINMRIRKIYYFIHGRISNCNCYES